MNNKEYVQELTIDDLHEKYKWIAELIGLDNLIILCEEAGGAYHYIPQTRQLIKDMKYQDLINEYDGGNLKELGAKYGVSESTVRRLLGDMIKKQKCFPFEGQVSLFH